MKFTDEGGIHIAIHCQPCEKDGHETICIEVRDTGIGIPEDKIGSIFEKFIQADSSISRKYGGTGLGLAITKTLTEIMGGSITVKSKVGFGTAFTVCLPLVKGDHSETQKIADIHQPSNRAEQEDARTKRILLVEDYAPNVMVAGSFLGQFGYPYDVAVNGSEAVERVKTGYYTGVLMDVQMHGMNGLEATQLIRAHEKKSGGHRTTIIGMTAHALEGDRERCLGVGMDDYISKPFSPDDLREKLALLIEHPETVEDA